MGFHLHDFLVVVGLLHPIHLGKSLKPSTLLFILFLLLQFPHLFPQFLTPLGPFLLKLILLVLHLILNSLADQGICASPLNILNMEVPKILSISGRRSIVVIRIHEVFVIDGGVVAQPLEVFFIAGIEMIISLGDFHHKGRYFSVLEGHIRYVALLVERVGSVVA